MSVAEYLRRHNAIINTPFKITSEGIGYYMVDGNLIPRKEFERQNMLPFSLVKYTGTNADKTKNWLVAI